MNNRRSTGPSVKPGTPPAEVAGPRTQALSPPYGEDTERLLRKLMPPQSDVEPLLLFRVFALHRDLFARLGPLAAGLLTKGLLPVRDREVVISRITARAGAEYEWGVHAALFGPAVGLDQGLLDALATRPADAPAFDERTRLLVTAVDQLHDEATLSADAWTRLRGLRGFPGFALRRAAYPTLMGSEPPSRPKRASTAAS